MNIRLPSLLRNHPGKIIGVLLGLLFGLRLFGILFGFLLGALTDIFLQELRLKKYLRGGTGDSSPQNSGASPQLQFVLLVSSLALHTAVMERSRKSGLEETSPRDVVVHPPDLELLQEITLRSLPLSTRGKSAIKRLFKTYGEDPGSLRGLDSLCYPEGIKLKASEQIAVSRLFFEAALLGGGGSEISGSTYRFIAGQCSLLGIENRYRDVAGAILKARDTTSYELLGVSSDTSPEEIRKVYRTLAAQFHPDGLHGLSPEQREAAAEAFLRIRRAYEKIISE